MNFRPHTLLTPAETAFDVESTLHSPADPADFLRESRPEKTAAAAPLLPLRLLWEQRLFLWKVVLRTLVLSSIVSLLLPVTYEARTALMPPDPQTGNGLLGALGSGALGGGMMGMAGGLLGLRPTGALFIGVLSSASVEDRLIDRFDLRRVYWVKTYAAARHQLEEHSSFSEEHKSGILTITVNDRSAARAAQMAGAYVEELDRALATVNTSSAHRERVFLEERLLVVKQELDRSAQEFSRFSSQNTAIDIQEQGRALVGAAATLQGERIAAESELRGLEEIYADNNVRVRSLRARVAELDRQLQQLGGAPSTPGELYPSIRQLPVLGLTYADLYRRMKINEAVYEALTKQYEMARVQEAKEVPSVKVLDPAAVPERRSGPPRTFIVAATVVTSFLLAAAGLFARHAWQQAPLENSYRQLGEEIAGVTRSQVRRAWEKLPRRQAAPLFSDTISERFPGPGEGGSE